MPLRKKVLGYDQQTGQPIYDENLSSPMEDSPLEPLPDVGTVPLDDLDTRKGVSADPYADDAVPQEVVNDAASQPEVRRAEPNIKPTGAMMDLSFIQALNNAPDDETFNAMVQKLDPVQKHIYDRSYGYERVTPQWATQQAESFYKMQDERQKLAEDPVKQAQRGKPMTSTEVEKISQLDSVAYSLDLLQQKLDEIPATDRGPIAGRIDKANPYNVQAQEVQNIITSITPGLARGVFGEVGVLTDTDMERYKGLLPNPAIPKDLADKNMANLREKLNDSKMKQIETMRKAGMDVSGFDEDYNRLAQAREAKMQQAQNAKAQAAKQQQAPLLPVMRGKQGERVVLMTPENPAFDPTENNGQPYYEAE